MKRLPLLAGLIVAAFDFAFRLSWIDGTFLNSYPFLSDDGFDWYFQGAAFWLQVSGIDREPWPFLRNPLFVFVTAADYASNCNGRLALLVQSASLGITVAMVAAIACRFRKPAPATLVGLAAMIGMPLWVLHLWMLSDQLCAALMMLSVERLIAAEQTRSRWPLIASGLCAILAGLTQTYGILAFGAMAGAYAAIALFRRHELRYELVGAICIVFLVTALLLAGWRAAIPHRAGFIQFGSLAISGGMLGFYLNVWAICFLPLTPALIAGLRDWRTQNEAVRDTVLSLSAAIIYFAALTFVYQYRESRYTLFYVPLVFVSLILLVPSGNNGRQAALASMIVSVALAALLSWGDVWQPKVFRVGLAPARTWLGMMARAQPEDRFDLQRLCGSRTQFCSALTFDEVPSSYRQEIMREYVRRTLKSK